VFIVKTGDQARGSAYGRWRYQGRYALRDVYLVRCGIEELAAAMAAQVVTRAGLKRLHDTVDSMRAAADVGDLVGMAEGDAMFHARIFEIAGSPLIQDITESIAGVVHGSRQVAFADPQRVCEPIQEHLTIIKALAAGDPLRARLAMRAHIRNVADRAGLALRLPGVQAQDENG